MAISHQPVHQEKGGVLLPRTAQYFYPSLAIICRDRMQNFELKITKSFEIPAEVLLGSCGSLGLVQLPSSNPLDRIVQEGAGGQNNHIFYAAFH